MLKFERSFTQVVFVLAAVETLMLVAAYSAIAAAFDTLIDPASTAEMFARESQLVLVNSLKPAPSDPRTSANGRDA